MGVSLLRGVLFNAEPRRTRRRRGEGEGKTEDSTWWAGPGLAGFERRGKPKARSQSTDSGGKMVRVGVIEGGFVIEGRALQRGAAENAERAETARRGRG